MCLFSVQGAAHAMTAVLRAPVLELTSDSTAVLLKDEHHPILSFYVLEQLRRRRQFCDIELQLKGCVQLPAHRVVLASSSPFFMKVLSKNPTVSTLALDDYGIDISSLELLVDFFYSSKLRLTQSNSQSVCQAAHILQLERIEKACCKYMSQTLSDSNVILHLKFAQKHEYSSLQQDCQAYIAKNILTVSQLTIFADLLTIADLSAIFSLDCLAPSSEQDLVQILLAWMKRDPLTRQANIHSLLLTSDLPQISQSYQLLEALSPPSADMETLASKVDAIYSSQTESERHSYQNAFELLVAVGGVSSETTLNAVDKYKTPHRGWVPSDPLPRRKAHAGLVNVRNKLYSLGGLHAHRRLHHVDIFEPERGLWTQGPAMPLAKSDFGAVYDGHKRVYCIGGLVGSHDASSVDILNVQTTSWSEGPELRQPRSFLGAAVIDSTIYAVGGANGSKRLATVERLDTTARQPCWEGVASLNVPRSRPGVVEVNGLLFAVGGYSGTEYLSSVECYCPAIDKWTLITGMSSPRNSPAVGCHGNKLVIAGGYNGKKLLDSVESYDPELDQWSILPSLPTPKCDFAICSVIVTDRLSCTGTWM